MVLWKNIGITFELSFKIETKNRYSYTRCHFSHNNVVVYVNIQNNDEIAFIVNEIYPFNQTIGKK